MEQSTRPRRSASSGAIDGVLAEFVVFDEDGLVIVPGPL